jgi:hypothetical protein
MKPIAIALSCGLSVLGLLGWQLVPARADQSGGAVCTFVANDQISPGLSLTPSTGGTVTTNGETGRIDCVGSVEGKQVTGPGTWGVNHSYGPGPLGNPTCLQSSGSGTYFYTVPTLQGSVHVVGIFTYTALGPGGTFSGKASTTSMSGTFQFVPTAGNCLTDPVTAILIAGAFAQTG